MSRQLVATQNVFAASVGNDHDHIIRGLAADRTRLIDFLRGRRQSLDRDESSTADDVTRARRSIVIIEDDEVDTEAARRLLARSDIGTLEVASYTRLRDAREQLARGEVDVILLDLGLPDVYGLEAVETAHRFAPATPIIVLSGNDDEELAVASLRCGAQDYILKASLDLDTLRRAVRLALARADSERSLRRSVLKLLVRSDDLWNEIGHRSDIEAQLRSEQRRLSQTVAELEAANEVRTQFLATVSHELRTPLTSIIGYSDILRESDDSQVSTEVDAAAEVIHRNSHRLLSLVEDLLVTADLDSHQPKLERQRVDLVAVTATVVEMLEPTAQSSGHEVTTGVQGDIPRVWGDRSQLERVMINLLSNAIKFTPPGGRLDIGIRRTDDDSHVELRVADDGPGMPPAELERIFDRFVRGRDAVDRQIPGTGLGLAITKSIVDAHNGEVTMISQEGVGTVVTVRLPIESRSSAASVDDGPPPEPLNFDVADVSDDKGVNT